MPVGLVFLTSMVLGAVTIFGGFKVQQIITDAVTNATTLDGKVKQAAVQFDTTKSLLDTTDAKIDAVAKQSLVLTNAQLSTENIALQQQLAALSAKVDKLIPQNTTVADKKNGKKKETEPKN